MSKKNGVSVRVNSLTLDKTLENLSSNMRKDVSFAAAEYLVGNQRHGLKHYPKYKYVTRKRAYGKTFFSERQRRYVMAKIRSGEIDPGVPHRTGRMQRGWHIVKTRSGARIENSVPHVIWSHSPTRRANLNRLVGWRTTTEIEATNKKGMLREAKKAIAKLIKS